jgi:hypothetical protein
VLGVVKQNAVHLVADAVAMIEPELDEIRDDGPARGVGGGEVVPSLLHRRPLLLEVGLVEIYLGALQIDDDRDAALELAMGVNFEASQRRVGNAGVREGPLGLGRPGLAREYHALGLKAEDAEHPCCEILFELLLAELKEFARAGLLDPRDEHLKCGRAQGFVGVDLGVVGGVAD